VVVVVLLLLNSRPRRRRRRLVFSSSFLSFLFNENDVDVPNPSRLFSSSFFIKAA
jgi:hypothetical protein